MTMNKTPGRHAAYEPPAEDNVTDQSWKDRWLRNWTPRERVMAAVMALLAPVALLAGGGIAWAALPTQNATLAQIGCPPGVPLIIEPDTMLAHCGTDPSPTATTSPSSSPSATATSPAPSPSTTTPPPSPTTTSPAPSPTTTSPSPSTSPSTSPSPSTTSPPAGPLTNCFGDVKSVLNQARLAACGYPNESNTGVPDGVQLFPAAGLTINQTGIYVNRNVTGCVVVNTQAGQEVTIRNFLINATGCGQGGIQHWGAGKLTVEDTTVYCTRASGHGFWVQNTTAVRIHTYGCENGFELNANSTVRDSMIGGSEVGNSSAHGDDIQSQGGNDVFVLHNTFVGLNPITSSIISNPDNNRRWTIRDNFFAAGAYTLYCPENVGNTWIVTGNRFFPYRNAAGQRLYADLGDLRAPAYGYTDGCGGVGTWTGNYRDDTLASVSR